MLASISPVGEASRGQRWWLTAAAYGLGSILGGTVVGALAGGVGGAVAPSPAAAPGLLAAAAVAGLAADRWRLPSWHRQVDERWLGTYRGWVYGLGFGVQLGFAVATIVPASVTYVFLVAAGLSASPGAGALLGAVFGAVRAVPLLLTRTVRTPAGLRSLHARLAALEPWADRAGRAVQAAVAAAAVVVALR